MNTTELTNKITTYETDLAALETKLITAHARVQVLLAKRDSVRKALTATKEALVKVKSYEQAATEAANTPDA